MGYSPWGHKELDPAEHTHNAPGSGLAWAQGHASALALAPGPPSVALLSCDRPELPALDSLILLSEQLKGFVIFYALKLPRRGDHKEVRKYEKSIISILQSTGLNSKVMRQLSQSNQDPLQDSVHAPGHLFCSPACQHSQDVRE